MRYVIILINLLCMYVSAESVNSFKSRLETFRSMHDFVYDYRAKPLATGISYITSIQNLALETIVYYYYYAV